MANIIKRVWNQNRMVQIEDLRGMTFQAEAAGHTFQISGIDDDGNTVALTGTPSGVLLRPDNTDVALTCSVSGGVVSATLPANCYDVPGRFGLTIFITSGSSKTAIYAAVGTVTRTSSGTVAPGTSQSVVDLINAINAAVNSIPASYSALLADIAPTYSNSALYSVGQYVWYDGDLKRCIVPITTAESYTAAHWTSAVLGQDVSDLKSALNNMMVFPTVDVVTGKYVRGDNGYTGNSDSYVCTDYVEIPDAIKNGAMSFKSYFYNYIGAAFYNASKQYISGYSGTSLGINATREMYVRIPENAKYFRASLRASEYSSSSDFAIAYQNSYDIDESNRKITQNTADITSLRSNLTSRIELDEQTMVSQFAQFGYSIDSMFEQGQLLSTTGQPTTADYNKFVRSKDYIILAKGVTYYLTPQGHTFYIFFYDETYTKTSTIWGKYQPFEFTLPEGSVYMKVEAKDNSNLDITPANVTERVYCNGSGALYKEIETARGSEASLGARLDDLTNTANSFYGFTFSVPFEQGAIGGNGVPYGSNTNIRTGFIKVMPSKYKVEVNGYRAYALFYDKTKTFINGRNIWGKTADFEFETDESVGYVRLVANLTSGEEITPVDNALTLIDLGLYKDTKYLIDSTPAIPEYFFADNYLADKETAITENCLVTKGTSFLFITDVHLEANSKSSKGVVKHVIDNTPVPFIITGGDIPTAYSATAGNEKAEVLADIKEWMEWVDWWGQDRVYQLRGNHDYVKPAIYDATKYYNIPNGGVHQIIMSKFIERVHAPNPQMNYYYFDNETQKIRYLVIDGHNYNSDYPTVVVSWVFQEQLQWIADVLLASNGYSVVIISHETYNTAMDGYASNLSDVGDLVGALKTKGIFRKNYYEQGEVVADFTNSTAELVCFLSGHSHRDEYNVDSNGVLCISTTCDAYYAEAGAVRTVGTVLESAFDVFTVDTEAKTIKTVRVGAGNNRGWNYITGEVIT